MSPEAYDDFVGVVCAYIDDIMMCTGPWPGLAMASTSFDALVFFVRRILDL